MKALVTGGGGFLGRRIVELLLARGDEVSFIARGKYPAVEALGATGIQADLRDKTAVRAAVEGMDVVFHVAALAKIWGPIEDFRSINVDATRNIIDAMEDAGVPKLVFTSTPSVTASGEPVRNGGMDVPYPEVNDSPYGSTKAEAERMVTAANSKHIATVSLRPRLIYGPRENNMFPNFMARARSGRIPQVGDGSNKADVTYIDNAAWAHLDALDALTDHTAVCAGKAYFISDGTPVILWDWLGAFLDALDIPRPQRQVSYRMARMLGSAIQWFWRTFNMSGEPRMTPQIATALGTDQYYDMEPAFRDLGYSIRVTHDQATSAMIAWLLDGKASVTYADGTVVEYPADTV